MILNELIRRRLRIIRYEKADWDPLQRREGVFKTAESKDYEWCAVIGVICSMLETAYPKDSGGYAVIGTCCNGLKTAYAYDSVRYAVIDASYGEVGTA